MNNIDNMSKETMEEQFNKMCILTDDGKAKYWKPAVFGYAEDDREAPLDKFFPETVKQFIRTIRLKDREELIGEMPKKKVVTRSSVGDYYKYEDWEGFNDAMCQVKKLITEHYN